MEKDALSRFMEEWDSMPDEPQEEGRNGDGTNVAETSQTAQNNTNLLLEVQAEPSSSRPEDAHSKTPLVEGEAPAMVASSPVATQGMASAIHTDEVPLVARAAGLEHTAGATTTDVKENPHGTVHVPKTSSTKAKSS